MSEATSNKSSDSGSTSARFQLASIWNRTANVCGVLGLVITVAWTFPSDLWKAYFSAQAKMEEDVQMAIGEMAKTYKEYALAQGSNISEQARMQLNAISITQIGYQLDNIRKFPDSLFENSSYFQNITLAGLAFQVQRYDDAIRFNNAAVFAAERENLAPVEAYNGMANSIVGRDGQSGMARARDNYKQALSSAMVRQKTGRRITPYLRSQSSSTSRYQN